jgi:hypothetical protein
VIAPERKAIGMIEPESLGVDPPRLAVLQLGSTKIPLDRHTKIMSAKRPA